jgi:hypothetical protein
MTLNPEQQKELEKQLAERRGRFDLISWIAVAAMLMGAAGLMGPLLLGNKTKNKRYRKRERSGP